MKELQLIAFKNVIEQLKDQEIYYLYWPQKWRELIKNNQTYKLNKTLKRLTEQINSLFPEILFIQNNSAALKGNEPWIVAKRKLNSEIMEYIVEKYLEDLHTEEDNDTEETEIKWNKGIISDIFKKDSNAIYKWVPALVAHKWCENTVEMSVPNGFNGLLTFYPIYFGNSFEALSEPVRKSPRGDYFSYVYCFELVTRGIENEPFLKVSFGIRRYFQKKINNHFIPIRNKREVSLLVSLKNPFVKDEQRTFAKVKVKMGKNGVELTNDYRKFFESLMINHIPSIMDIFHNSKEFIENEELKVLIVYSENTFKDKSTRIERGLGIPEREELFKRFITRFPELQLLPPLNNINTKFNDNTFPLVAPDHVENITLEVITDTEGFVEEVEQVLVNKGISVGEVADHVFKLNSQSHIILNIEPVSAQGIVKDLEVEKYKSKAAAKLTQSIVKQFNSSKTHESKLALIEIPAYEKFDEEKYKDLDPKMAIREGLARTRRLSQFIHPLEEEQSENRLVKSLLDLLTDKGFRKSNWVKGDFTNILSLSLLRLKKEEKTCFLPILVRIKNDQIKYLIYGQNQWRSLEAILLTIHQQKQFLNYPNKNNDEALKLQKFLNDQLLHVLNNTNEPIYLIIDASLRYHWLEGLQNGRLTLDKVPELGALINEFSNLRVIRINQTKDVPQYLINQKGSYINRASGLFKGGNGIYYSIGGRPDTIQTSLNTIKYNSPSKFINRQTALEIIVLGAEEDERDKIACMADTLRRTVPTWSTHVKLPYPMHMVRSIKKYLSDDFYEISEEGLEDGMIEEEDGQITFSL